jgi:hypothetical protein
MQMNPSVVDTSFPGRLRLALKLLFNADFAREIAGASSAGRGGKPAEPKPAAPAPERLHASGLSLLAAFQREGRLVDFLQQDLGGFSDQDIGAAARVVHTGCRKLLQQFLELAPATSEAEGDSVTVPQGFDAQRFRLTGNLAGQPPFRGTLKHHGWVAREVRLPAVSESVDPRVIAPAEVELP